MADPLGRDPQQEIYYFFQEERLMKILSVMDPSFQNYGAVLGGYDVKELLETLDKVTPLPDGVEYVP